MNMYMNNATKLQERRVHYPELFSTYQYIHKVHIRFFLEHRVSRFDGRRATQSWLSAKMLLFAIFSPASISHRFATIKMQQKQRKNSNNKKKLQIEQSTSERLAFHVRQLAGSWQVASQVLSGKGWPVWVTGVYERASYFKTI